MTEPEAPKPPVDDKPERLKLEDVVTPIFDAAMGRRFALMRMSRLWDQRECGERFGINPTTISHLEAGRLPVPRHPFSLSRLEEVFGPTATKFILLNRYAANFDSGRIQSKFWDQKLRVEAKPRKPSIHWTKKRLQEGKPVRGATFMGIPGEVWDLAQKLHGEQKNNATSSLKRKEKKPGGS